MIKKTWFYETNLKNYPELQETLISETLETKLELKSYFLSGAVGYGKTTQAILLARKHINECYAFNFNNWHYSTEPNFVTFTRLLELLNDRQFGNEELKTKAHYELKDIQNTSFLILDDLRCNFTSIYQKNMVDAYLLELLSIFYADRKNKIIIITTNNLKKDVSKIYSDAVTSRIFGLCFYYELKGKDRRISTIL